MTKRERKPIAIIDPISVKSTANVKPGTNDDVFLNKVSAMLT